jgi:DNA-directed RNA polymerase subunit RPC12/RpoP
MADIRLKCANCSKEVAVSEFAKTDGLHCTCGGKLLRPAGAQTAVAKPKHGGLSFKSEEQMASENVAVQDPEEWRFVKHMKKDERAQQQPRNTHLIISWLVFLALGGALGYVRYVPNSVQPTYLQMLKDYGIAVFGVLYVTIMLRAFKDNVFQGLLCLIPLYPFYYIILICDDFYLRAVVAGAMVGVGQDSLMMINSQAQIWISVVQAWIAHGG